MSHLDEAPSLRESEKRRALSRAHQELHESERRFREMVDALPAAIYTADAEGRLTRFNRDAGPEFATETIQVRRPFRARRSVVT